MLVTEISKRKFSAPSPEDKVKAKDLMDKKRKEYYKLVKGIFEFTDAGGGWFEFNHRVFPDDIISRFRIEHGEVVELPIGIIKHLNNTVQKIRAMPKQSNEQEKPNFIGGPTQKKSRVRFTTMEVM